MAGALAVRLDRLGTAAGDAVKLGKIAEFRALQDRLRLEQPDNIASRGHKVYSQNDEDGLIALIFETVAGGTFLEIGVGDGIENNTHLLLLKGWRGVWIEAGAIRCEAIRRQLGGDAFGDRFRLVQDFVAPDTVAAHYRRACDVLRVPDVAFFSLDIDGDDLAVLDVLLSSGARPDVICVEYNGKFPPPIALAASDRGQGGWALDDYFGASLQSFHDLLAPAGYVLVTCNLVGVNAFFVRRELWHDRPSFAPSEVWQPLRLHLAPLPTTHIPTMKFARDILNPHDEAAR